MSLVGDCGAGFSSTFARLGQACSCDMVAGLWALPNVALALGWTRNGSEMNRVSSAKAENPLDQENDKTPGVATGAPNQ